MAKPGKNAVAGYVLVLLILAVLTYLEFAIVEYPQEWLGRAGTLASLIVMSVGKFLLVILYFMHLKEDDVVYSGWFASGMFLALASFIGFVAMFVYPSAMQTFPEEPVNIMSEARASEAAERIPGDGANRTAAEIARSPAPSTQSVTPTAPVAAPSEAFELVMPEAEEVALEIVDEVEEITEEVADEVEEAAQETVEATEEAVEEVVEAAEETVEEVVEATEEVAEDVVEEVEEAVEETVEETTETVEDVIDDVVETIEDTAETVTEAVSSAIDSAIETAEEVVEEVEEAFDAAGEVVDEVVEETEEAVEAAEEAVEEVIQDVVEDSEGTEDVVEDSVEEAAAATEEVADISWDESLGASVYGSTCLSCHMPTGDGVPTAFPPLHGHAADVFAVDGGPAYMINVVLYGLEGAIDIDGVTYAVMTMEPWKQQLSDEQVAAVVNYIVAGWGDGAPSGFVPVTAADVEAERGNDYTRKQVHDLRSTLDL